MRLLFCLLFLFITFQIEAQDYLYTWPDSLIQLKSKQVVKERCMEFNKGIEPTYFDNEQQLLDSLKKMNLKHMITRFWFPAFEENMESPSVSFKSITMDKEIPFLRYRVDKSELGDIEITAIQGHNNW